MAGIYVHIPFCHSKCAYCDFFSTPFAERFAGKYVSALENEYHSRRCELAGPVTTIYIGGGTPSSIDRSLLERLFAFLPADGIDEYTIEVNPEDVSEDFALWLKNDTPVSRVSMGVQSLDDSVLRTIGRRHTAAATIDAYKALKSAGIDISLDLIYGLPGQDMRSWRSSLERVLELKPEHLSCYLLSYEPGTRLTAMKQAGRISEATETEVMAMYDVLTQKTSGVGYEHYEISNFALPGHRALHNSSYWNLTPYLGLGTGAHSFDGQIRRFNPNDIKKYIECSGTGFAVAEEENLSERYNDYIITALRTNSGLDMKLIEKLFGLSRAEESARKTAAFVKADKMWRNGDRAGIVERHWLTSDAIMLEFIEV